MFLRHHELGVPASGLPYWNQTAATRTNVSGELRRLLDSFECDIFSGAGYQLKKDGSLAVGQGGGQIRAPRDVVELNRQRQKNFSEQLQKLKGARDKLH